MPIKGIQLGADGVLGPEPDSPLLDMYATDQTNAMDTVLRGGRRNVRSAYVMGKLGIPVMQIWNQTVPFWDFHRYILVPTSMLTSCEVMPQNFHLADLALHCALLVARLSLGPCFSIR